jgi:hypothetical protein
VNGIVPHLLFFSKAEIHLTSSFSYQPFLAFGFYARLRHAAPKPTIHLFLTFIKCPE